MRMTHWLVLVVLAVASTVAAPALSAEAGFQQWLTGFKQEAKSQGIPDSVLHAAFDGIHEDARVVKLDRKQPEGKISFTQYRANIVTMDRIRKAKALYEEHRALLDSISQHYKVPPQYILALWGIETNFGSYTGNFSTINSLATLAYEGRRADLFKKELMTALRLVAKGEVTVSQLIGSWAGAMGHCQFMPSSFEKFAVDWNKDGKKDIWKQLPDVFASIANYLSSEGWNDSLPWGEAVRLGNPEHALAHETLYQPVTYSELQSLQVTTAQNSAVASYEGNGYLMHPGQPYEGTFLVYDNYHVLLKWNKSRYFATAVGLLADAIKGA